jgi:hypothetical protein
VIRVFPIESQEKVTNRVQRRQPAVYLMLEGIMRISLPNCDGTAFTGNALSFGNCVQKGNLSFAVFVVTIAMNSAGYPGTPSH